MSSISCLFNPEGGWGDNSLDVGNFSQVTHNCPHITVKNWIFEVLGAESEKNMSLFRKFMFSPKMQNMATYMREKASKI